MKKKIAFLLKVLATKIEGGKATKAEVDRYANATRVLSNEVDCGRYGKAFELLNVSAKARKAHVSAQGKVDGYFYLDGKRHAVEYKSNGGRIEALYRLRKPEDAYIVYTMDFETRQTYKKDGTPRPTKHYEVEPIIMRVSDFLAVLEHCNAVKTLEHKGKGDRERAVQGDSAKLAKVLADYPITYDPDYNYTAEDFEDIELW